MRLIANGLLTAMFLYGFSEYTSLINIDTFKSALLLAVVINVILFFLRFLSGFLKFMGCLTLGISYVIGLLISIFSLPMALLKASSFVPGYEIAGYREALILSLLMTLLNTLILDTKRNFP